MKILITSFLAIAITAASLPVMTLAADHSDPVTNDGAKLKYNTPYYLNAKNLHRGGVTSEAWGSYDYVLFSSYPGSNGTPIIFENTDGTDGFVKSDDLIRIKSSQTNKNGWNYWTPDEGNNSIYLSNDTKAVHRIYGSSKDNSIGLGTTLQKLETFMNGTVMWAPYFMEYKAKDVVNDEQAWMKQEWIFGVPPLVERQTPFIIFPADGFGK